MAFESIGDLKIKDLRFDGWQQVQKTITYDGISYGSTLATYEIFTVTGDVVAKIVGICTTNLAGASALTAVGTPGNTAAFLAETTGTDIDAGDIWHDNAPDAGVELFSVMPEEIIANSTAVVGGTRAAAVTSGVIRFICLWHALSDDGDVTGA